MTVEIKGVTIVTLSTNILGSWTLFTVRFVADHRARIFYDFITSNTGQTFSFWVTSGAILNFTFIFITTQNSILINQIESRLTFWARFIIFTELTVFNFTISFASKIKVYSIAIMANFTSSIDDWFTVGNNWDFTNLFREI